MRIAEEVQASSLHCADRHLCIDPHDGSIRNDLLNGAQAFHYQPFRRGSTIRLKQAMDGDVIQSSCEIMQESFRSVHYRRRGSDGSNLR